MPDVLETGECEFPADVIEGVVHADVPDRCTAIWVFADFDNGDHVRIGIDGTGHFRILAPQGTTARIQALCRSRCEARIRQKWFAQARGVSPGTKGIVLSLASVETTASALVKVSDPVGAPAEGVAVVPDCCHECTRRPVITDADGAAFLSPICSQTVQFVARDTRCRGWSSGTSGEVTPAGQTVFLRMLAPRRVSGRVTRRDGTPVESGVVTVIREGVIQTAGDIWSGDYCVEFGDDPTVDTALVWEDHATTESWRSELRRVREDTVNATLYPSR
jgi:hypothetical protein